MCRYSLENSGKIEEAAKALRLTSRDLINLGLIEEIIPEPSGGAHKDIEQTAINIKQAITKNLSELKNIPLQELLEKRYEKYRKTGKFKRK